MLTTVSSPLLKSERLSVILHPTLDYSASLIGCHVVQYLRIKLESGTFLMKHLFLDHGKALL